MYMQKKKKKIYCYVNMELQASVHTARFDYMRDYGTRVTRMVCYGRFTGFHWSLLFDMIQVFFFLLARGLDIFNKLRIMKLI